ncbi:MAG: AzlC family ABC transporter permease [Acidimicrobiales bacterium]
MAGEPAPTHRAGIVLASLPIAAAIGVFGLVYGAAAKLVIGTELTVISSVIVFSGAAQFTMVALLAAGATPVGVLGGVTTLALRHLPLGAVLRPRLTASRGRRALTSWFLIDETTGMALTRADPVESTLAISGSLAYAAWVAGTIGGVAGGSLASAEPVADALSPVLFVGLAALTAATPSDRRRALLAGAAAVALLLASPAVGALGAIATAIVVAAVVRSP